MQELTGAELGTLADEIESRLRALQTVLKVDWPTLDMVAHELSKVFDRSLEFGGPERILKPLPTVEEHDAEVEAAALEKAAQLLEADVDIPDDKLGGPEDVLDGLGVPEVLEYEAARIRALTTAKQH